MKKKQLLIISSICVAFMSLSGCQKEPLLYEYGPFNYDSFKKITSNGAVNIILQPGTCNKIIRKTMVSPHVSSSGGVLTLNGTGEITIAVKDLESIDMYSGSLTNTDSVFLNNLSISEQSAKIILNNIYIDSTMTMRLNNSRYCFISGKASYLMLVVNNNPRFLGAGFVTDSCRVSYHSKGSSHLNTTSSLKGAIYNNGDIYYKGNPSAVHVSSVGSGQAIAQ
ncbi:MAG: GIN domain-containing protein [Cytophagaceae bacterium]